MDASTLGIARNMSDWSVWKALEDWRSRKHELDPMFAAAGVAPELESMVSRVLVDVRRAPPTPPLQSGNKPQDDDEYRRYTEAFYRHYDDSLFKAESLLRHAWVPEAEPLARNVRTEVARLRQAMSANPGKLPDFTRLEVLLGHYLKLDDPALPINPQMLAARKQTLIEVAGYPLLVQHSQSHQFNDLLPPLASSSFEADFYQHLQTYLETPWLHSRLISQWYATVVVDMAIARRKRDAVDDERIRESLDWRWPAPSVWLKDFDQADQMWYLVLVIIAISALFMEWWWLAFALIVWMNLSLGAFRREQKEIERRRAHIVARLHLLKKVRDRFANGHTPLERLETQLHQLDENGDLLNERVLQLLRLHQHTA